MPSRKPEVKIRRKPTLRKGPVKQSKRVIHRIKAAGDLEGSVKEFKDDAADGFGERFAGELRNGEAMPDLAVALELAVRSVMTALEELGDADQIYCRKSVERRRLEKACRDVSEHDLYPEVRDLRQYLESLFGKKEGRELHGMTGPTRRKPKRLLPQLQALVPRLKDLGRQLPPPRRAGTTIDRDAWLDQLEPGYKQLARMMRELERRENAEHHQRKVRDIALEDFDQVYGEALAFVRSVLCLAGYGDKGIWHLLPNVERRRLKREARWEREAREDGRREGGRREGGRRRGPVNVA